MLQAVYLMTSSKKGISAHQLHRILEITYKSAWFLAHRIRQAMRSGDLAPMGGAGGIVEIDETFVGQKEDSPNVAASPKSTRPYRLWSAAARFAASMLMARRPITWSRSSAPTPRANRRHDRRGWSVQTFEPGTLRATIASTMVRASTVPGKVHTNTVEGYYSIFKRGMKIVYHHCGEKHLHRYVAEFNFRSNNRIALGTADQKRAGISLKGITGKRLTYRGANAQEAR